MRVTILLSQGFWALRPRTRPPSRKKALLDSSLAADAQTAKDLENSWRAYDSAQRRYEVDLQLSSTRSSLFLVIQSALVALVASTIRIDRMGLAADRVAVSSVGLALAVFWLLAAIGSYQWIKTWRALMIQLGDRLGGQNKVSDIYSSHKQRCEILEPIKGKLFGKAVECLSWFVRPTLVVTCLPLVFIAAWIYLGWFV